MNGNATEKGRYGALETSSSVLASVMSPVYSPISGNFLYYGVETATTERRVSYYTVTCTSITSLAKGGGSRDECIFLKAYELRSIFLLLTGDTAGQFPAHMLRRGFPQS